MQSFFVPFLNGYWRDTFKNIRSQRTDKALIRHLVAVLITLAIACSARVLRKVLKKEETASNASCGEKKLLYW